MKNVLENKKEAQGTINFGVKNPGIFKKMENNSGI